jgi:hypothetical protein
MNPSLFKKWLPWVMTGVLSILLAVLLIGYMTEGIWEPQFLPSQAVVGEIPPSLTVQGIIFYTNKARLEIGGLPPLRENSLLNRIAADRLRDMFAHQYFAHESPTGESVTDLAQRRGYQYKILAENIGLGLNSDEKMVQGWLQSPSHRENILRPECTEIGVAVGQGWLKKRKAWVSVQVFGLPAFPLEGKTTPGSGAVLVNPSKTCPPPDPQLLDSIKETKNRLSELDEVEKKLRQELEESNPHSAGNGADRNKEKESVNIYNKKVVRYNALVRDLQSKMEQYSQLVTRYNNQVTNYNACIKREVP